MTKYINPYTDFGFKKIFGEEASKPLLIDFLNTLLPARHRVSDVSFTNPENLGSTADDRKSVFDIYCKSVNGERFIVEMQKAEQEYFKDRTVFYSTFPIREQALKGKWDYELKAVYCIGILNFKFQDYPENSVERNEVIHTVELKDQNNSVFYDKLKFIYLEMPNFNKNENELKTHLDKWLYFIKHLDDFESMPHIFEKDALFVQALKQQKLPNLALKI
jgi:predicted transposase/invertase (TIGR01784 family)